MTVPPPAGFSWRLALMGFLAGAVVVSATGVGLWWARVIPSNNPRPVAMTLETLPEKVLGFSRVDVELRGAPASDGVAKQLAWQAKLVPGIVESYQTVFGAPGITSWYGQMAGYAFSVAAVNGGLDVPVAETPEMVEYIRAVGGVRWLPVGGTKTTKCRYGMSETVPLMDGETGQQAIARVVDETPARGGVYCVRYEPARNLSVGIMGSPSEDVTETPSALAAKVGAETDRVWEALD
jgi:hypothetical protein